MLSMGTSSRCSMHTQVFDRMSFRVSPSTCLEDSIPAGGLLTQPHSRTHLQLPQAVFQESIFPAIPRARALWGETLFEVSARSNGTYPYIVTFPLATDSSFNFEPSFSTF